MFFTRRNIGTGNQSKRKVTTSSPNSITQTCMRPRFLLWDDPLVPVHFIRTGISISGWKSKVKLVGSSSFTNESNYFFKETVTKNLFWTIAQQL